MQAIEATAIQATFVKHFDITQTTCLELEDRCAAGGCAGWSLVDLDLIACSLHCPGELGWGWVSHALPVDGMDTEGMAAIAQLSVAGWAGAGREAALIQLAVEGNACLTIADSCKAEDCTGLDTVGGWCLHQRRFGRVGSRGVLRHAVADDSDLPALVDCAHGDRKHLAFGVRSLDRRLTSAHCYLHWLRWH